ncbi:cytochrome d ubiquinol oxidase subunit II [Planctomicrobium piriforme]|uniref:Cytochrome d ubiquinol oxidase subunit II n=1 Tax=Planctomicrobium piriforme TaxID=1576369 RepID=A0A1I3K0H1_9PLAN|nr:cytochrome d ubiquinol oxidase subunit II [Planctomicrobium piriforme]SFI66007.1 cytochrome d ubiquinol oxidase subunit II [Planctomicrobium piriforme]
MDWQLLWFVLLGVLLAGYAALDGFDLGVGMLHPIGRNDQERRLMLNSIGPLWDGNEVWLVTFGGAMFAAFPEAYATVFSGYYEAFMLVLGALIFRAVSIEFRSKLNSAHWRSIWDWVFCISSFTASLTFGIAVGSAMVGIPLDQRGVFRSSVFAQLGFYPILTGVLTVTMFAMHGGIYLCMKTEGDLLARIKKWTWRCFAAFLTVYLIATAVTLVMVPRATQNFESFPWAGIVVVLSVLAIANIPRCLRMNYLPGAFISSSCTIAALVFLFGVALFPNLVTSSPHPEHSLTIYNASSSQLTLKIMSVIALIGMPFVVSYTAIVYWTFRGPVKLDKHSY